MKGSIPVSISPFFWLVAAGFGWLSTGSLSGIVLWTVVVFLSLLVHEYGHACTARYFGQNASIQILPFGGITERYGKRLPLWQEFFIVLNGPLAGLALAFLAYFLLLRISAVTQPTTYALLSLFVTINIFWTAVNLLPVGPLDGGQMLRIVCQAMFGVPGIQFAYLVGVVVGVGVGLFFFSVGFVLGGALLLMLAFESGRSWQAARQMTKQDQDQGLQQKMESAIRLDQEGRKSAAMDLFRQVRGEAQGGVLDRMSAQAEAALLSGEGHYDQALQILQKYQGKLDRGGSRLYQEILFATQRWDQALAVGTTLFQEMPELSVALLNARASARLEKMDQVVGWLQSAKHLGAKGLDDLIQEEDFSTLYDRLKTMI